jgi:hypothetical protein
MQHSKEFVKKVRTAKVRQAPMITGDEEISRRSAHAKPYLTKSEVRLSIAKLCPEPHGTALQATFGRPEYAGFKLQGLSSLPLLGSFSYIRTAFGATVRRDYFKEMNIRSFINAGEPYTALSGSPMWPEVVQAMQYAATRSVCNRSSGIVVF